MAGLTTVMDTTGKDTMAAVGKTDASTTTAIATTSTRVSCVTSTCSPVREDRENRISYNGGQGGISARPRPEDERAEHERHIPPAPAQRQQVQLARANPQLRASRESRQASSSSDCESW